MSKISHGPVEITPINNMWPHIGVVKNLPWRVKKTIINKLWPRVRQVKNLSLPSIFTKQILLKIVLGPVSSFQKRLKKFVVPYQFE